MDFINQVKKLKEMTKSPRVKELCESFLNGGGMSKEELISAIENQTSSVPQVKNADRVPNHVEVKMNEENAVSKRAAAQLMESWGGLKTQSSNNAGTWVSVKDKEEKADSLLENVDFMSQIDDSAKSFMEAQGLKSIGVKASLKKIQESSIYTYPKAKVLCDQFTYILENKGIPEFMVAENFVAEFGQLSWDTTVSEVVNEMKTKLQKFSREIEVAKVLESIKNSGSSSFYSELKESLNTWLLSEQKSTGMLVKSISKYNFNPVVRNLINHLNLHESDDARKLEIPDVVQGESRVAKIFSPVIMESDRSVFQIGGAIFEGNEEGIKKLSSKEVSRLDASFLTVAQILAKPNVQVNENGIFVQLGKKIIRLVEENESVSVYLGNSKLNFTHLSGLAKILGLESASHFAVNESQTVNDIINLYQAVPNIVELDFAKSIVSNIYEGVSINLIKWNEKIVLQRINEGMRENSLFEVNGTQAVKMVKDFLRYDISEGLTEFLEGEQKLKSIMINDRAKVLENITRVEGELQKLHGVMESNSFYKASPQINQAVNALRNELVVLKEKWNQINSEIKKIEEEEATNIESNVNEDQKFNIGDFIKVRESGETGKIISIDNTSGRYTVMMDNGKTSDFMISEIEDLEDALNRAGEENKQAAEEEEQGEEVKEANNFDKSGLSHNQQRELLSKFANMHGFSKAPKAEENEETELELDPVHGYNLTVNEAKEKLAKGNPAPDFSKAPGDSKIGKGKDANKGNIEVAPGNDKKNKGKVEGDKSLATAPENKGKTEFDGEDESGNKYDIGYNIREAQKAGFVEAPASGKKAKETKSTSGGNMSHAPESGKGAKETKSTTPTNLVEAPESGKKAKETNSSAGKILKGQQLAETPGKEGDIDFEVNDESGYNLSEGEGDLKKN